MSLFNFKNTETQKNIFIISIFLVLSLVGCKDGNQNEVTEGKLTGVCLEAYKAYETVLDRHKDALPTQPGMTIEQAKEITYNMYLDADEEYCKEQRDIYNEQLNH